MIQNILSKRTKEEIFWNWFEKNNKSYFKNIDDEEKRETLFNELTNRLHKVNSEITFEFSPIMENGIREFTISADGMKEYFNSVKKLVNIAPKMTNWKINAFRQRIPDDYTKIEYDDFSISYSDIYFKYADEGDKIGLELYIRDFDGNGHKQNAIYILLDGLIGEYDTVTKIDWIEWKKLDETDKDRLFEFFELRELIDRKKE